MERTLKEKQGAVGEQCFSVADEVMSQGITCCLERGAESRRHTTCGSSQAHRSETQRAADTQMPSSLGTPRAGLNVRGHLLGVVSRGAPALDSLEIYQNSEAGAPCSGILIVCVCVASTYFFLVKKEVVILTSSPDGSDVGGQWTLLRNFTSRTYRMLKIKQSKKEPIKC